MIVEVLMNILKALLLLIIGLFPTLPDFGFVANYIKSFVQLLHSVNMVISLPAVGGCLLAIILCYNARAIWSLIMWVIRKIPGVS